MIELQPETIVIVSWAFTVLILERFFPATPGQKVFRKGFWTDFFWYTIVQSAILGLGITALIEYINTQTGWSDYRLVGHWPLWTQYLFFFVVHDLYIYTFHYMQHKIPFLWRFHEAHHSVRDVDFVAGSRSHPIEILINQTIEFAPIVLLGADASVAVFKIIIDAVWGMYIHSNLNVQTGKLQLVINGPEMHRWHHANDPEAYDTNFATKLAIWDWLFGTAFLPKDRKPPGFGVDNREFPEDSPALSWQELVGLDWLRQIGYAFRPRPKNAPIHLTQPAAPTFQPPPAPLPSAPNRQEGQSVAAPKS